MLPEGTKEDLQPIPGDDMWFSWELPAKPSRNLVVPWLDQDQCYPLVMTNSSPWYRWPIEIDGLPINSMVDLSMAIYVK